MGKKNFLFFLQISTGFIAVVSVIAIPAGLIHGIWVDPVGFKMACTGAIIACVFWWIENLFRQNG